MESRIYNLVRQMHEKFDLANESGPCELSNEERSFRVKALQEELNEYAEAKSLVDQYDALLDLIVFAVGTLERQGLPLLQGFEAVMQANMAKKVGQNGDKRGGFKRDLVKPEGWTGPEAKLQAILDQTLPKTKDWEPVEEGHAPKYDSNKVRVDLLPIGPMLDIADVFGYGAKKYFANSYRQGETVAWSRTYGSIMRHMMSFWSGEDTDPESGKAHLAHAGTQLMILMEHTKNNKDKDDRFKR